MRGAVCPYRAVCVRGGRLQGAARQRGSGCGRRFACACAPSCVRPRAASCGTPGGGAVPVSGVPSSVLLSRQCSCRDPLPCSALPSPASSRRFVPLSSLAPGHRLRRCPPVPVPCLPHCPPRSADAGSTSPALHIKSATRSLAPHSRPRVKRVRPQPRLPHNTSATLSAPCRRAATTRRARAGSAGSVLWRGMSSSAR